MRAISPNFRTTLKIRVMMVRMNKTPPQGAKMIPNLPSQSQRAAHLPRPIRRPLRRRVMTRMMMTPKTTTMARRRSGIVTKWMTMRTVMSRTTTTKTANLPRRKRSDWI